MNHHSLSPLAPDIRRTLVEIVGPDAFDDRSDCLSLFSQDIWAVGTTAAFVAAPSNTSQLSRLVAAASKAGIALNPRGAGMSYTKGYTPDRSGVGMIDFSRMNRILEINAEDMYVTVEAGCTWTALYDALKENGLRTPFWGPLSGLTSTIGGGLSQNNAFFGAGAYGTTGDSVLSVAVVLANGDIIRTGTAGQTDGKPFFRHYGPDLAGLFCGDAGALGFKAEVTLKLIPMPDAEETASFEFQDHSTCAKAMAAVMRANRACEVFGFDPNLQRIRLKRASLMSDVKTLSNVVTKQTSVLKGLKEGARVAFAGRKFVDDAAYSLHFVVEGYSAAGVREDTAFLKDICRNEGGKEIENSIPKIMRANPFGPLNSVIGPDGERWVPVHGIVAPSKAQAAWAEIEQYFAERMSLYKARGISTGVLITTLGATGFLIEPVFFWPEKLEDIHRATVEKSYLAGIKEQASNPENTEIVATARRDIIEIFSRHGAAHFQIGRTYPYKDNSSPQTWRLLEAIKATVDPAGVINPGVLGLGDKAS